MINIPEVIASMTPANRQLVAARRSGEAKCHAIPTVICTAPAPTRVRQ